MSGGWWGGSPSNSELLRRLSERAGHPLPGSQARPFDFDATRNNWTSIPQLEAVVEFYANFDDPWRAGAVPRRPGQAGYITVSFRDPTGRAARVAGNVVTLDGNPDLTRVHPNYDTILLDGDTRRPNTKRYRIAAVNNAAHTLTVDPQPPAGGVVGGPMLADATSTWTIHLRAVIVLIDSFGAREANGVVLEGRSATSAGRDAAGNEILSLDGAPDLSRVNRNFDTIYLPSDTTPPQPGRPRRTYRIIDRNDVADTVTVNGNPVLENGSSPWHIPAGLSGEMPALNYNIAPPAAPAAHAAARVARGHDHFDGVLFVIHGGRVIERFRWNSYTSRDWGPWSNDPLWQQYRSSLRGNRPFHFRSYRSGNAFRNYSFRVVDVVFENTGVRHAGQGMPGPGGVAIPWYDGVREARFYFETPVTEDTVPLPPAGTGNPRTDPLGRGKTDIRLHHSQDAGAHCNSAGCIVSPIYTQLRRVLIDIFQGEYAAFQGGRDAEVDKPRLLNQAQSQQLYNNAGPGGLTAANWDDRIQGILWLVRPDEPPS